MRTQRRSDSVKTTQAHHSAQPTCSDGMAANWLVKLPTPRGALASVLHHPAPAYCAIVSTKPGSIRGGASGNTMWPSNARPVSATIVQRTWE